MLKKQFVSVAAVAVLTTGVAFAAVQQDKVMYKQADGTYVVNTTSLCSNVKGFKGATPVEVYIKNNKVIKVEALPNREGPKFYDKVKQGLFPKFVFSLFHKSATKDSANPPLTNVLTDSISQIVSACPGEIGVAVIVNNRDTVKVNNKSVYPMMSVFKVHQALALCNDFDNKGISIDTLVNINRDKLDPKTWSPMLKDYSGPVISLTVRDLLRYTLTQSDNNASNLMFKDMVNVAQTDSFIATLIPRSSFQIAYTEEEMSADHNKAYSNYTSPLGAAMLMNRLFTEGLIDDEKQSFIKNTLKECKTGVDRIAAPLLDKEGVVIAHKTGSGYVNENGVLAAHNDVAYICLPNNISYTLAVFVKDFKGNESQASQYVAHISAVVYSLLMQTSVKS